MLGFIRKELIIFLTSVRYNTRIIVPAWVEHSEEYLSSSSRYFPLVGWIVAFLSGLVLWIANLSLPWDVSVVLSMAASVLITGAFHEDGFTDVCDGFGGGWTKLKILDIMKDSRIGAFGTIGIILVLLLKFTCYRSMSDFSIEILFIVILASHSSSRFWALLMTKALPYAREDELSKAKPIVKQMRTSNVIIGSIWGFLPWLGFLYIPSIPSKLALGFTILPFLLQAFGFLYLRNFYKRWLEGYTGDCLGAVQQVTEILYLIGILSAWKSF
ncbi:adenosylcobinamide-GDP ribazoletransferase [Leptospira langatensis]|uniref:Adenosylcobinamide-GDP ribazoletransferase n=1 Tax=Leptospira langatensis TaxID=2484983 RepID=A0A5F1ZTZ0_9LEPT|nr:adenosylcobinamide-GDP ribazoletransferase [Leptospira langatensis]TGK01531.1 adenosylcobinamide-GDP ribazoletransferase [Leptospira langatensis]TGL42019.1 adenosylcobinamide-GDP ribazoletransferase [Leptospira langatensis]